MGHTLSVCIEKLTEEGLEMETIREVSVLIEVDSNKKTVKKKLVLHEHEFEAEAEKLDDFLARIREVLEHYI